MLKIGILLGCIILALWSRYDEYSVRTARTNWETICPAETNDGGKCDISKAPPMDW